MWTRVTIDQAAHQRLLELARAALPREFVAALGGALRDGEATVDEVLPLPNVAADDDTFAVDPLAFARAEHELARRGHRWLGFVHSHPRGAAAPSSRDREQLWPHCLQLIAAPRPDAPTVPLAAFVLRDAVAHPLPLHVAAEVSR